MLTSDKLTLSGFSVSGLLTSGRRNTMNKLLEMRACLRVLKDTGFVFFSLHIVSCAFVICSLKDLLTHLLT